MQNVIILPLIFKLFITAHRRNSMKRYISFLLAVLMLVTLVPTAALADNEIEEMKASNDLKTLIKYWEGVKLKAYKAHPSEEYWTIGYGHYGSDVYEGMEITAEQADAYFEQDIAQFEAAARRINEKYGLNANQNQFDALVSLAYNFGPGWVEANTGWRLARYIKSNFRDSYGNPIPDLEIADAFAVLCSAGGEILPGLVKRRINEAEIFLYGSYNTALTNFVVVIIDANGGTADGNRVVAYNKDKPYGSLPTASRQGFSLDYWKDSDTGSVLTGSTVADKSRYITAVWSGGIAPETYKLTVSGGEGSGSYTEGTKVKLVPAVSSGKAFVRWDVTGAGAVLGGDGYYYITMPASDVTAVAVWRAVCPLGDKCPTKDFTDNPVTYWAHNDIDSVIALRLFKGTSGTTFGPDIVMSRCMLITVLYRLEGSPDVTGYENRFNDVDADGYYYNALLWGSHNNISNGYSDGRFAPDDPLTREQLVTFLHRYANYKGYNTDVYTDIGGYSDAAEVSPFARESMCWAIGAGIVNGTGNNTLSPQDSALRAQVAAMFNRFAGGMA
jgi:GH24 family phage-related lysozyme (muramidase)